MRENGIGLTSMARGGADCDVGKNPDAIHHDAIETGGVLVQPSPQTRRETEATEPALAEGVNRKGESREERGGWRVLRNDLNVHPYRKIGSRQLAHRLGWATIGRRETSNDVENLHRSQKQNNPSLSKEIRPERGWSAGRTTEQVTTGDILTCR